ncbi:hypothetical protein C5167_024879 [Papaver somniferum]|uniref:Uncharacterized protein n=1 Tax=Papaver somniferum TaxID=3469 RepID=A0A4Y7JQW1_PAPSO|nr:hypothetical protein C5167_024879 [Papaver somniferum]
MVHATNIISLVNNQNLAKEAITLNEEDGKDMKTLSFPLNSVCGFLIWLDKWITYENRMSVVSPTCCLLANRYVFWEEMDRQQVVD